MPAILGLSAFYHDSAAALMVDGQVIAAAQEERFTRKKHDPDFPANAIQYCGVWAMHNIKTNSMHRMNQTCGTRDHML